MKASIFGIGASIFAVILPFVFYKPLYSAGVNSKFFFVILFADLVALLVAWSIFYGKHTFNLKRRWLLCALVVVLAVYYTSTFAGVFPERSLWSDVLRTTGVLFLTHVVFASFFLGEFLNSKDWSLVRRSVAISAGIFAFITFLGIEGFGWLNNFLWIDLNIRGLTFGNNTFAGAYLVIALCIALVELVNSQKGTWNRKTIIASVVLIVLSPTLFHFGTFSNPMSFLGNARSSSASAWLMLIFLAGWYVLGRFSPRKIFQKIWAFVVIATVVLGVAFLFTPGSIIQKIYTESSTATRLVVWDSALKSVKERPLLGYGPENFELIFQKHFDDRLYLKENLGEIWFDRAHNVFVDTLVDIGVVGLLALLSLFGYFGVVVWRAKARGVIKEMEAVVLLAFPVVHLLQLQTAFDTVGTYALLGIMVGYGLWLERRMSEDPNVKVNTKVQKIFAGVLIVAALLSLKFVVWDEYVRQVSLLKVLTTRNSDVQKNYIEKSLSRTSSFSSLRFSSASFTKGVLEQAANEKKVDRNLVLSRFSLYRDYFKAYLEKAPNHYRARMNYAYTLLLMRTFGEDHIAEAKEIIRGSYALSPGNPLTYALDALAELYSGNLKGVDRITGEMIALNPDIVFSQEMVAYFEKQKKQFPGITVLKLENL